MARFLRTQGRVILLRNLGAVGVPPSKTTGNIFTAFTQPPPPKTRVTIIRNALEPPPPPPFVRSKIITVFNDGVREHQRGRIIFLRNAQAQPDFDDRGPTFNAERDRPEFVRPKTRVLFLRSPVVAEAAPAAPVRDRIFIVQAAQQRFRVRVINLRNRAEGAPVVLAPSPLFYVLVFPYNATISGGEAGGGGAHRLLISTSDIIIIAEPLL